MEIPLKDETLEDTEKEELYKEYLRKLEAIKRHQEELEQERKNLEAQVENAANQ